MKLCSQTDIDALFKKGKKVSRFPFKIIYNLKPLEIGSPVVLISVPKRSFKKAVDRNLLKRRIREAYRTNSIGKGIGSIQMAIIFQAREVRSFNAIRRDLDLILRELSSRVSTELKEKLNEKS